MDVQLHTSQSSDAQQGGPKPPTLSAWAQSWLLSASYLPPSISFVGNLLYGLIFATGYLSGGFWLLSRPRAARCCFRSQKDKEERAENSWVLVGSPTSGRRGPIPSTHDHDCCPYSRKANIVARMEYTTGFGFSSFDPDSSSSDSSFDSIGVTKLAPKFNLDPFLLDDPDWTTTESFDQHFGSGSGYMPWIFSGCGNGSEPMLHDWPVAVEHNRDAQHKPAPPTSHFAFSSSSPQSYHNILDLTDHDLSPIPIMRMSSTSSSGSSYSNESTPRTPRRRQGLLLKCPATRSSLPAISQQKLEVLRNALIFHNPKPTADQSSFLAKALHIDESVLESWRKALLMDGISTLEGAKLGKPLKAGRVASWKQTIIRRGFQIVNTPSNCQIEFLAAGLRIRVEQLRQSFRENVNNDILVGAKGRGRIETELLPTTRLSEETPPPSNDKVQLVDSIVETATKLDNSATALLPSKPSTVGVDSLNSPPWVPLMKPETKPVSPVEVSDAKSQNCQHLQSIVDKIESVPDCKQSVEKTSGAVEIHATSNIGNTNMESIDEEEVPDLSPEEELAALLGPEYCHLAEAILSRFAAASDWDQWQFASGSREHVGGVENTPSSNSSQTTGNASSPNTSASGSSSGKRKSSGGGGEGPDDPEPNDGDGNMDPPPPKKAKTPQVRYDCPIFRRSLRTGSTVRSCALNGLEFRNLWDHLRKAHYGCETCGLKLDGKRADKTHLRERGKNASICHADLRTGATFDIGIDLFAELEEIYDNRTLSPEDKWKQWWKLLFPDAGEAPDPRHHDTISISTANIPAFQESFHNMWRENQVLPALDDIQLQNVSTLLERLLRTAPIIHRYRHQSIQPRTPRTPITAANMQAVAYTAGQSPSYIASAQEQDFSWGSNMLADLDSPFSSDGQGFSSNGNLLFGSSASNSFGQGFGGSGNLSFGQNT